MDSAGRDRRLILDAELDASSAIGQPILGIEDLDVAVFILFELNGGASAKLEMSQDAVDVGSVEGRPSRAMSVSGGIVAQT